MSRGPDQTVMKFQKKDGRFVIADLPDYPTDHENASGPPPPASLGRHTSSDYSEKPSSNYMAVEFFFGLDSCVETGYII